VIRVRSPKVSIGLPVFNGESYVGEAIESILEQSFEDFELIISDNASSDGTEDICREFARRDARVQYCRNESNVGVARNWTKLVEMSSGRYFKWVAHDDVQGGELLAKCVEPLDRDPTVVLSYPRARKIDEYGRLRGGKPGRWVHGMSPSPSERYREVMRLTTFGLPVFALMRRNLVARTKVYRPYPGSPHVMLSELALYGRFFEVPEYLVFTREHSGRYSGTKQSTREKLAWFDPGQTRLAFPQWQRLKDYLVTASHAPIAKSEKWRCYVEAFRWGSRSFGPLAADVLYNLTHPVPRVCRPSSEESAETPFPEEPVRG